MPSTPQSLHQEQLPVLVPVASPQQQQPTLIRLFLLVCKISVYLKVVLCYFFGLLSLLPASFGLSWIWSRSW
jgi:hypothetical protein